LTTAGNMARIKVGRHEECVGCGACPSGQNVILEAVNELGAKPGQRVKFVFHETNALLGAFVVFVLPLIMSGLGAWIGFSSELLGAGDAGMLRGAILFFCLSLVLVKSFDRRLGERQKLKPIITQILR